MGLLIGTIGMSPNGVLRGTLGSPYLIDGVPVIPAMIGMFAASELFALVGKSHLVDSAMSTRGVSLRKILTGFRLALDSPGTLIRGGLIGTLIGAIPGVRSEEHSSELQSLM